MSLFDGVRMAPLAAWGWRQAVQPVDWREDGEPLSQDFGRLLERIRQAKRAGAALVWFAGSQVFEDGLGSYLVQLLNNGWITHLATTGAGMTYDIQAATTGWAGFVRRLPQDLPRFGGWQEVGLAVDAALTVSRAESAGLGESLGAYFEQTPPAWPRLGALVEAYRLRIPVTAHLTIGCDEFQSYPGLDFRQLGRASGLDFQVFCRSVSNLSDGVFLNLGSQVTGVELFLKALSIARNLGYPVHPLTTANFDRIRLGDYRRPVGYGDWDYYYRPRKNVVHRPVSLGGEGFHFEGEHQVWLPRLVRGLGRAPG